MNNEVINFDRPPREYDSTSAVLEWVVVKRLQYPAFLSTTRNLVFSKQFAFRPSRSLTAAIIFILNHRWSSCENQESVTFVTVRAPYSADWNFRQFFFAIWYTLAILWHPRNFTEIVTPPSVGGGLNARGVAKYSDFWHLECCISETVQDRR